MDVFGGIINYLTDSPTRFIKKLFFVYMLIITLMVIDGVFSFSYYYNLDRKLTEVEKIENLLDSENLTVKENEQLCALRQELIARPTFTEKYYPKLSWFNFFSGTDKRNPLVHFITSSWFLIITAMIIPFIGLFSKSNGTSKLDIEAILIVTLMFVPILLIMSWIWTLILAQIPLLNDSPWINYVLNFAISWILVIIYTGVIKNDSVKSRDR